MEHWTRSIFSTVYLSFEGVDVANLRYLPSCKDDCANDH